MTPAPLLVHGYRRGIGMYKPWTGSVYHRTLQRNVLTPGAAEWTPNTHLTAASTQHS